jgi:hypothetical protein
MGIMEEMAAKALSQMWGALPVDKKMKIKESAMATEVALHEFNVDVADDSVNPEELEAAINKMIDALGSATGQAVQAWFWSLFRHA